MTHITKLKSPLGKQTTVIMNKFIFSLLVLMSLSNLGKSQSTGASIDDINENRLLFDLDEMTQDEWELLDSIPEIELIYTTAIGGIGVYQVTQFPFTAYINDIKVEFGNIIETNTGLRPGNGTGEATETDNYDFKSILPPPNNGGSAVNTDPLACPNYNYSLRPDRKRIRVAIFDSGINNNFETEGYNANVIYNKTMIGDITLDNEAEDDNNHGTHIAHIIHNVSGSLQGNFVEYMDIK